MGRTAGFVAAHHGTKLDTARSNVTACWAQRAVGAAATIRVWKGRASVTAGPFAETREQLGGFYLLEARDLNEAIRLASQMPPARLGSVEVRPIKDYPAHCPD